MSKEDLTLTDTFETRLPEHELLLSFNNDSGREKFENWWWGEGKALFDKYCEEDQFE